MMTNDEARLWLVRTSLAITGATFAFFILAPLAGYPLRFDQAIRLIEIIFPVFLGYVGAASQFVFRKSLKKEDIPSAASPILFGILIKGPIVVFLLMLLVSIVAFGYSNRVAATPGSGLSVNILAGLVTAALGLLAVSTNIAVSYLFSSESERHE